MALHDTDKNRTTASHNYLPWIVGIVALAGALFFFMGDKFTTRSTAPSTTTSAPSTPAPATK